jgi:hypothetical protein
MSLIRAVLLIIGTFLASSGDPLSANWESISGVILLIIPVVWSMVVHSDAGKLKAVEKLPDVERVIPITNPDPKSAIAVAINNPAHPKVGYE